MVNVLVKCVCDKRFPVNPEKNTNRKVVFCPWCGMAHTNSFFDASWKPNEKYWKEREARGFSQPFTISAMKRTLTSVFGKMVRKK